MECIQVERKLDWAGLLAYATDTLDLRRSRVTRAWRIRHSYESAADCDGLRVYEALDHKPNKKTVTPQPVGSPLTAREYQAATRFYKAVGDQARAVEVLTRIANGEKPVEGKGSQKRPRLTLLAKMFAGKVRGDVRKDARKFVATFVGKVRTAEAEYVRKTDEAIAAATTDEAKSKLVEVLRVLKEERKSAWDLAKQVVSLTRHKDFVGHELAFAAEVERMLDEAYGISPAVEPPASGQSDEQPPAAPDPSAN